MGKMASFFFSKCKKDGYAKFASLKDGYDRLVLLNSGISAEWEVRSVGDRVFYERRGYACYDLRRLVMKSQQAVAVYA